MLKLSLKGLIAMLLILGSARRASEGERMIRARAWPGWAPLQLVGRRLDGKKLGIYGFGKIGQALAQRARGQRELATLTAQRIEHPEVVRCADREPDPSARVEAQRVGIEALRNGNRGERLRGRIEARKLIAERAKEHGVESVVFDRGGFRYHGVIRAIADGAREAGLKF